MLSRNKLWLSTYVLSFINNLWLRLLPVLGFIYPIIFSFKWCCSDKYVWITPSAWNITNETYGHAIITKVFHLVWTPLFIHRGLRFLKNHGRGGSRYFCKNDGRIHIGMLSIERGPGKHWCFSLIMYGFCSNHALYPACLSFIMFFFF